MGIVIAVFTLTLMQGVVSATEISGDIILPPVLEGFGFPPDFGPVGSYGYTFQAGSHISPVHNSQPIHYNLQPIQPPTYVDPYQPESPWIVDKIAAELGFVIPIVTDSKLSTLPDSKAYKIPITLNKVPETVQEDYPTLSKETYEKSAESEGSSSLSSDGDFGSTFDFHDFHFDFQSHDEDNCPHKDHDHHKDHSYVHDDSEFKDFEFAATKALISEDLKDREEHKPILEKKEETDAVGGAKTEYRAPEKNLVPPSAAFKPSQPDPLFKIIPGPHNLLISNMAPYPYLHPSAVTKNAHVKPTESFFAAQKKY